MSNDDVSTWTPEHRAWFCDAWKVLVDANNGQIPEDLSEGELECAYQLKLLPRPYIEATITVDAVVGGQHYKQSLWVRLEKEQTEG